MAAVMLVEDDFATRYLCESILRGHGLQVDAFGTIAEGESALAKTRYDLLIIDRGLPDGDGALLLRRKPLGTPAMVMTVQDDPDERASALRQGATDYMLKPFHPDEFWIRARQQLPEEGLRGDEILYWANLELEVRTRRLRTVGSSEALDLTAGEVAILHRLLGRPGLVIATDVLADLVARNFGSRKSVSVIISRLRKKLEKIGAEGCIRSLPGAGYYLDEGVGAG